MIAYKRRVHGKLLYSIDTTNPPFTVYKTTITLILVTTNVYIMKTYGSYGLSVYESAVRCEIVYLLFLCLTIRLHKSKTLFAVTLVSLVINMIYLITDSTAVQYFIYDNYKIFNIILFECLLFNCINTTSVYLYLKRYLNNIKSNHSGYKKVLH